MPGTYTVTLAERVNSAMTAVGDAQTFKVVEDGVQQMSAEDKAALVAFQQKAARLQGAVAGALDVANTTETRLDQIQKALDQTPAADPKLRDTARDLHHQLDDILVALRGDPVARQHEENTPPSISQRAGEVAGSGRMSTARPTGTQVNNYQYASEQFAPVLAKLRSLVDVDLTNLEKALDTAGVPHTPGRIPAWKPE